MSASGSDDAGVFRLEGRLGEGGGGVVHAARHATSGWPVAIKLLRQAEHAHAWFAEARAIGVLDHPRIVALLDVGRQPAAWARTTGLPAGAPYLVMERATGTLGDLPGDPRVDVRAWPTVVRIVSDLLDALAWAHAHGVLHRDVKPSNVLVGCARSPLEGERAPLDGLRLADFGIASGSTGSPAGPAGTPRFAAPEQMTGEEQGPGTDLWAVGAVLRWLVAGVPSGDPGTPELRDYVDWLQAPRLADRPDRAADARRALRVLSPPPATVAPSRSVQEQTTRPVFTRQTGRPASVRRSGPPRVPPPDTQPPRARLDWPLAALVGVGLGRLHLRPPPWVGDEAPRRTLWRALREAREGAPSIVALHGPAGAGVTRHASWLARHAHAAGLGHVVDAFAATPEEGWRARARGDVAAARERRLVARVGESTSMAGVRVWLEECRRHAKVVVVLERPARVEPLADLGTVWSLTLPTLNRGALRDLLASVLVVDDAAAAELLEGLEEATPGQLLERLRRAVAAGRLGLGAQGFGLVASSPTVEPDLPAEVGHALGILALAGRPVPVEAWAEQVGDAWRSAREEAVLRGWWRKVASGVTLEGAPRDRLLAMVDAPAARRARLRWAEGAPPLLRARLRLDAEVEGSIDEIVALTRSRYARREPDVAEASALALARVHDSSLRRELRAMAMPLEVSGREAPGLVAEARQLLGEAVSAGEATTALRLAVRLSCAVRVLERPEAAREELAEQMQALEPHGAPDTRVEAWGLLAHHQRGVGDHAAAEVSARRALDLARGFSVGAAWEALAWWQLGTAVRRQDRFREARQIYRDGAAATGVPVLRSAEAGLGVVLGDAGRIDEQLRAAEADYDNGNLVAAAAILADSAGALTWTDRKDEALSLISRALRLREAFELPRASALSALAMIRLVRRERDELAQVVEILQRVPRVHPLEQVHTDALTLVVSPHAPDIAARWGQVERATASGVQGVPGLLATVEAAALSLSAAGAETAPRALAHVEGTWARLDLDPGYVTRIRTSVAHAMTS